MLTALGILVSTGCVLASVRRLQLAVTATVLDPDLIASALRGGERRGELCTALRDELLAEPGADWEREVFAATDATGSARVALMNEQLAEVDYRAERWARVPRVCASISSSFGFLLAFAMVASVAASTDLDVGAIVSTAISVVAVGLAGAAFCVALQIRSGKLAHDRLAATDALVSCLETMAGARKPAS